MSEVKFYRLNECAHPISAARAIGRRFPGELFVL